VDGVEFRLPLADIASARLVPNWDSLMTSGGRPVGGRPGDDGNRKDESR